MIGRGPSGIDIVDHLSKIARRVTLSQHKIPNQTKEEREKQAKLLPPNCTLQDDVECLTLMGAKFIDGSHSTFDAIIYTTG